jgi:hypothetical protein
VTAKQYLEICMTIETASQTAEVRTEKGMPERCLDLFLISFLILFFELAFIRWFGSNVVFLTFFTNLVLMACFLGMSVGLLSAGRRLNLITWFFPLAMMAAGVAMATRLASRLLTNLLMMSVGRTRRRRSFSAPQRSRRLTRRNSLCRSKWWRESSSC